MELIETIEVGSGGAASIEFTSIPQDGTDLLLAFSLRETGATTSMNVELNNTDSTAVRALYGTGSSATSFSATALNVFIGINSYTANTFGNGHLYIPNYAGSSAKSMSVDAVNENNATAAYQAIYAATFGSSAVTSIQLIGLGSGFAQYSSASLYKIVKAA